MEKFCKKYSNFFIRTNEEFVARVHEESPIILKDATKILSCEKRNDTFLQQQVISCCSHSNSSFPSSAQRFLQFPGPMASAMSKRHLSILRNNDYLITEKSDGTRAMMYVTHVKGFPRWMNLQTKRAFSFYENLFIESSYQKLKSEGGLMKKLNVINIKELKTELVSRRVLNEQKRKYVVRLSLRRKSDQKKLQETPSKDEIGISRKKGWFLTYLFDRTFQFYLCLEEFVFPEYHWMKNFKTLPFVAQSEILLDGEIVFNLRDRRWNYSIYDIVCYQNKHESISCNNMDMGEKIEIIKNRVVEPHHFFHGHYARIKLHSLMLIAKHFYLKKEISKVFSTIKKNKSGEYIYKEYNKNDGLIFTPNQNTLYSFLPGPCKYLFKWKFDDKLTVDFQIKKLNPVNEGDPDTYGLYYKRCNKLVNVEFFKEITEIKAANEELIETVKRELGNTQKRIVVECFFRSKYSPREEDGILNEGYWEITHIRLDKVKPNTFLTVISVLTAMIENLTKEELTLSLDKNKSLTSIDNEFLKYFHDRSDSKGGVNIEDDDEEDEEEGERENVKDEFLHLQLGFYDNEGNTPILKAFHNEKFDYTTFLFIKDCVFRTLRSIQLEDEIKRQFLHMHKSNKDDLPIVRLMFLPSSGLWKIIDFKGDISKCFAPEIVDQLEKMVDVAHEIRKGIKERMKNNNEKKRKDEKEKKKRERKFDFENENRTKKQKLE